MSSGYIGEIRIFAGNFAPAGWALCQGQLMPISENEILFQLIGTTYGGDGESTFALPDLRGRVPVHFGDSFVLGETGGVETVTLTTSSIPAHGHAWLATTTTAQNTTPVNNAFAGGVANVYTNANPPNTAMDPAVVGPVGGSQPHDNMQPYLCMNYIISLFGIFPQQS